VDAHRRTALTFRYERLRAVSTGIMETAGTTFLLLIAVRVFEAGATGKGLIAAGASFGLLISPLVVHFVQTSRLPVSRAAARLVGAGALSFVLMAALPFEAVFVAGAILATAAAPATIPLLTQVYQDNYPALERGKLFSRTVMIRIGTAALFSHLAGSALTGKIEYYRWLLLFFALALGFAAFCLARVPSRTIHGEAGQHPFRALRYARDDRLFQRTLICWMFMGFANLMMLPLRVEYLANPRYDLKLDVATIALVTGVIPNVARLILSPVWGWLFDRMNFFALRVTLNVGFILGILAFFTSNDLTGLVIGGIVFGISNAGGDVAWSLWVTKFAPPERVADYMSVHTFFTGIRGVLAPLVAFNVVTHFSLSTLGWVSAGLIAAGTLILVPEIKLGRRARKAGPLVEEVSE
jgi:MFS family permease